MEDQKKISIGGLRLSKTLVLVVGIILLFIPSVVMLFQWLGIDREPLITKSVSTAELTMPDGKTLAMTPGGEQGELLDLFLRINSEGNPITSLPSAEEKGLQRFTVKYSVYGSEAKYDYYVSENPSECYFVSNYDNVYKMNPSDATALLNTSQAESVYSGAALPVLTAMGGELRAQTVQWNYKTYGGDYKVSSASFDNVYDVNEVGDLSLNFSCSFSRTPDSVTVSIVDETGEQLYSGPVEGLLGVDLKQSVNVEMTLNAAWEQKTGVACYGTAVYRLKGMLHAPAEFYLSTSEIQEGGLVVLSGINVLNPSACKVKVEPQDTVNFTSYTYEPKLFQDGDYVRALIPVSADLKNGTCGYRVTVTVEQTVYTMQFTAVKAGAASPATKSVGNMVYVPAGTTVSDNPYEELFGAISSTIATATDYSKGDMTGKFMDGCQGADGVRGVYGTVITYGQIDTTIVSHDNSWVGGKSTSLNAMHSGKVVYIGSMPYTGGLVVVDHGYGLLSWYWNLSKTAEGLEVGSTVATGDKIGDAMGESFSEVYNNSYITAHTALTVFGTPVNSKLFQDGVRFADGETGRVVATVSTASAGGNSDLPSPTTSENAE